MAKSNTIVIKLLSSADTGYYYVAKKIHERKQKNLSFANMIQWHENM